MCFKALSTFFKTYDGDQEDAKQDAKTIETSIGKYMTKALLRCIDSKYPKLDRCLATFPSEGKPVWLFSFDQKKLYFCHSKDTIASLHLPSRKLSTLNISYAIHLSLCRINGVEKLYVQSHNGTVTLIDAKKFTILKQLQNDRGENVNHNLFFKRDVKHIYAFTNGKIAAWDTDTDNKIWDAHDFPPCMCNVEQANNKVYFRDSLDQLWVFALKTPPKKINISNCIYLVGEKLYSANKKGITILNTKNDTIITEIPYKKEYQFFLTGIVFYKDKLFIRSPDCIQIFDTKQERFLKSLEHPTIAEIRIKDGYLFSKDYETCIKEWDLQTYKYIHTFNWENKECFDFCIEAPYLFAGFSDGTITIWNLETQETVSTFKASKSPICTLVLVNDNLISMSYTDLKIWNAAYFRCKTDQERLACLMLENAPSQSGKQKVTS